MQVQTFCSLYGGTWPSLGPQMGGLNRAKTAPDRLRIRSEKQHSSQSKIRPVKGRFGAQVGGSKTAKSLIGVVKNHIFHIHF